MEKRQFDVADLPDTTIQQVQSFEEALREESGEEIVLIAYKNEDEDK